MKENFHKINKVFIISSGRTGTKFFGKNLCSFVPDSISVHEPDKVSFKKNQTLAQNIKRQGIFDIFFLKALGLTGARNLSIQALKGDKTDEEIINRFLYSRRWVRNCHYYFESNYQLYGLPTLLSKLPETKIVIIFRDPRDWVKSWMNKGYWYDNTDLLSRIDFLGFKRLTPYNVDLNLQYWQKYSRFERLCWVWNYMNTNLYQSLGSDNIISFKFEDLFLTKDLNKLNALFGFIFETSCTDKFVNKFLKLSDEKINQNLVEKFPEWQQWATTECKTLQHHCGELMLKTGYGQEKAWKKKTNE